jgi:putative hydrolase of the HAD superfamily
MRTLNYAKPLLVRMTVSAVVFDLDYTLAVPQRDRALLLADALAAVDAPQFSREEYLAAHGRHLTTETRAPIFADLFETADTRTDPNDAAAAYRRAIADALHPVEDAASLVDGLRDRYAVGLLTNGPIRAQRDKLETLGWTDLFDATVITGELPAGKPDERAFRAALDALDVPAEEAVYVGDQIGTDIEGANAAGMKTVQVLYDGGPGPAERADAYVDRADLAASLPDVVAAL